MSVLLISSERGLNWQKNEFTGTATWDCALILEKKCRIALKQDKNYTADVVPWPGAFHGHLIDNRADYDWGIQLIILIWKYRQTGECFRCPVGISLSFDKCSSRLLMWEFYPALYIIHVPLSAWQIRWDIEISLCNETCLHFLRHFLPLWYVCSVIALLSSVIGLDYTFLYSVFFSFMKMTSLIDVSK